MNESRALIYFSLSRTLLWPGNAKSRFEISSFVFNWRWVAAELSKEHTSTTFALARPTASSAAALRVYCECDKVTDALWTHPFNRLYLRWIYRAFQFPSLTPHADATHSSLLIKLSALFPGERRTTPLSSDHKTLATPKQGYSSWMQLLKSLSYLRGTCPTLSFPLHEEVLKVLQAQWTRNAISLSLSAMLPENWVSILTPSHKICSVLIHIRWCSHSSTGPSTVRRVWRWKWSLKLLLAKITLYHHLSVIILHPKVDLMPFPRQYYFNVAVSTYFDLPDNFSQRQSYL